MKSSKNIFRIKGLQFVLVLLAGFVLGWLVFGGNHTHADDTEAITSEEGKTIWTCSMHPQIRMDEPGKCPLCGMDLIPLKEGSSSEIDDSTIQMTPEAIALANIQTTIVGHQDVVKDLQLYGVIQVDERLKHSQTSHVNGRIEELYINFTGEPVKKGQIIAKIYSPELMTAQQELLEAAKLNDLQPGLLEAAKEKFKLWKMTDDQINDILDSKTVSPYVNIYANTNGVVMSKNVNQGDYINQGSVLYDIANLSRLWGVFDAYENELAFLKVGDSLQYTLQSLPGKIFKGKIAFINPIMDATSRTAKIRVEINNHQNLFKPEMYAIATVKANLKDSGSEVSVPKSAVLWTGKRSLVYVKEQGTSSPAFKMREVVLGASLGDSYMIASGLENGDEVVTNGAYTIDASAQLEGKISMMNEKVGEEVQEEIKEEVEEEHPHRFHKRTVR